MDKDAGPAQAHEPPIPTPPRYLARRRSPPGLLPSRGTQVATERCLTLPQACHLARYRPSAAATGAGCSSACPRCQSRPQAPQQSQLPACTMHAGAALFGACMQHGAPPLYGRPPLTRPACAPTPRRREGAAAAAACAPQPGRRLQPRRGRDPATLSPGARGACAATCPTRRLGRPMPRVRGLELPGARLLLLLRKRGRAWAWALAPPLRQAFCHNLVSLSRRQVTARLPKLLTFPSCSLSAFALQAPPL